MTNGKASYSDFSIESPTKERRSKLQVFGDTSGCKKQMAYARLRNLLKSFKQQ
jgi:hypothetical protein